MKCQGDSYITIETHLHDLSYVPVGLCTYFVLEIILCYLHASRIARKRLTIQP